METKASKKGVTLPRMMTLFGIVCLDGGGLKLSEDAEDPLVAAARPCVRIG